MTPPRPCMGGWCAERLACENYSDPYTPGLIDHRREVDPSFGQRLEQPFGVEPVGKRDRIGAHDRFECVELATELLDLGGWVTGSQIDFLEGVSFGRICDHDTLHELQEMRDSRQREINLNK